MSIPAVHHNGVSVSDNAQKAELFNTYFSKHSSLPDNLPSLPPFYYKTDARLENINISEGTVQQILTNLNTGSATGPDGIGNRILRATVKE